MDFTLYTDDYFMNEALKEARYAFEEGEVPIGAVIVANNKIIARAHNQVEKLNDPTAHAEILAITSANNALGSKYLTECTLYVTLEPCAMCCGASYWAQLKKVVYGADDDKRGFSFISDKLPHPKTEIKKGILAAECSAIVSDFFKKLREK